MTACFFPGSEATKRMQHHNDTEDRNVHTASHERRPIKRQWKHGESVLPESVLTQGNESVGCDGSMLTIELRHDAMAINLQHC